MWKHAFDTCSHERKFHIDADSSWWPINKPRQSFYICEKCHNVITLQEKSSLDQVEITKKSLEIQERQTRTWMWANIISTIVLIIAFLTFLFWDKIINSVPTHHNWLVHVCGKGY